MERLLERAFGSRTPIDYERTRDGVSTQVYRLHRGSNVFYLRIAEEEYENLTVDAELNRRLRHRGVGVPDVVYVEPFDRVLRRSVLITNEVPGLPLSKAKSVAAAASVARAAGGDLAVLNQVPVEGFGWIRRDQPVWPLVGVLATYGEFVTSYLPDKWPGELRLLFSTVHLGAIEAIITVERQRPLAHGHLAHGDFDTTAIFQKDGQYTGLIDFGEIRGTEPFFDLGHFSLHDGETFPALLLQHLIEGYQEVVALPPDHLDRIRRSAILLGLRQLSRWISPERARPLDYPAVRNRARRLAEMLDQS
ncbi:MAG: phosphotransferase [Gammaproteobacteria bacterium]